ncbi:MAG TPA: glycerophosphodiester phosphodiesterase family protein [Candidatus Avipropionibacterium avicola]|uniref:Glycerophosphodiester phosphodiesterase family protein n=1 Tax=Candidatus Avipropionibacterium avicola TaxID=2840701 RepID=A0A9D1GZJ0_9ACTN|nr:glycerophosphodiester phosphodiesterase family protein [Candidatus Avipropionibacterium avicola]
MATAAALQSALQTLFDRRSPLIVAHRGTTLGSFPDNTLRSAIGALQSGADVIETDVIVSTDGEYFCFHNGYEPKLLTEQVDLRTLTAAEIEQKRFAWQGGKAQPGPERLSSLLDGLPDSWINIDRSWDLWPGLLDWLDRADVAERVLLKSPPKPGPLAALAAHRVPYLYFPIVRTPDELAAVEAIDGINLIGAELLAANEDDPFADPAAVAAVAERYPFVQLNAINLENGARLYLDFDDDTSILTGPEAGWGRLVEAGATVIQTDWPHLLRDYLASRVPA